MRETLELRQILESLAEYVGVELLDYVIWFIKQVGPK